MTDLKTEFWKRIGDVQAGMLGVEGQGRLVAMAPQTDDDVPDAIWFIGAKGTDLAKAIEFGPQKSRFVVADPKTGLYADIDGMLVRSGDPEALNEVWNFVAGAWFEKGKEDPDICLMQFTPSEAEVSITSDSSAKFLYEIAKAHVAGTTPDAGTQGVVKF